MQAMHCLSLQTHAMFLPCKWELLIMHAIPLINIIKHAPPVAICPLHAAEYIVSF